MIPVSLHLQNFMSYGEDVPPLDFSQMSTACITGDNGHGKSALLDAITWALWGQTRAKSLDDVVRLGQEEAQVEFVFDLEDARYRVIRKRSLRTRAGQSLLELQGYDPEKNQYRSLSGNSIRETEAKISQLLHMGYETFINSVFILQGKADEFTVKRPGERKRILAEILGLALFDELETRAKMKRGELDHDTRGLIQRLDELRQEVARKDELAAAVSTYQDTLSQLQVELEEAQQRLEQLRQRQSALDLQSQRVKDLARRLQQLQHEHQSIMQQVATHQQRLGNYEAVLQQEQAITTGYARLQELREQESLYNARAQEYNVLQQRLTTLQHAISGAQNRLELEQQTLLQRGNEIQQKMQLCETIMQDAPRITQAYAALQEARQQENAMAHVLQQRYGLEQEKNLVERRIQQQRHALELKQTPLIERRKDWQDKEAMVPALQQQAEELRLQLHVVDEHGKRLEQIRTTGVSLKEQIENRIPQLQGILQGEIREQEEKRTALQAAKAHCPLCEKMLTDQERRQVIQKFVQEIAARQEQFQALQEEQRQLQTQRQQLRLEYKQLESQVEQRRQLEQQYATAQANLSEAARARDHLVAIVQALEQLDGQLMTGSYASEDFSHLLQIEAKLSSLVYDQQAHVQIKQALTQFITAEKQQLQLQQAETELVTLQAQSQQGAQQLATIVQTLQTHHFALAEQLELQEVTGRLEGLDFHPALYDALRQQLQEQQYVERQYLQLEAARERVQDERTALQSLFTRQQQVEGDQAAVEQEQRQCAAELSAFEAIRTDTIRTETLVRNARAREREVQLALGRSQSQYEHCLQRDIELQQKQQQLQQATEERTLYGDLAQMFGKNGIQAVIIDNAIPELEDEANHILSRVTNNAMHLTLETQRDTKTAGVAETLEIKISDTLGTRNYEMFSGGEAFRINLALRIALSKMLTQRAGARLRTLVIDEGFGTQDPEGLERLVEVIKAIRGDFAKIIIITHLRELKNAFETHLEVKKDPLRGSFYQVV